MKIRRESMVPDPPPQKIVIEMSEEEAQTLYNELLPVPLLGVAVLGNLFRCLYGLGYRRPN